MTSSGTSPTTPAFADDSGSLEDRNAPHANLPKIGHLLAGKYRIDGILGRGGMGIVAGAHQINLDRPVAVKFLRHALAESGRHRFTREAMAIAKMQSAHVVRVIDAGEEANVPFIVMERLSGHDLSDELRLGPLAPNVAVKYLLEACDALAEAHELGIVHRDLKPSNLFVARDGRGRKSLRVLDFGVSKWLDVLTGDETSLSTGEHGMVGTPAYASPEQLANPGAVDERTDVWSLGVVLYQCLSGRRPFEARAIPQLCAAILTAEPASLDPALGIPEELSAIVRRCLRKKPENRYQSVRELASALAAVVPPDVQTARTAPAVRRRLLQTALGAGVLGTLAVLGWALSSSPETRTATTPSAELLPGVGTAPHGALSSVVSSTPDVASLASATAKSEGGTLAAPVRLPAAPIARGRPRALASVAPSVASAPVSSVRPVATSGSPPASASAPSATPPPLYRR
jgi:serine/threonine-protein kinase